MEPAFCKQDQKDLASLEEIKKYKRLLKDATGSFGSGEHSVTTAAAALICIRIDWLIDIL